MADWLSSAFGLGNAGPNSDEEHKSGPTANGTPVEARKSSPGKSADLSGGAQPKASPSGAKKPAAAGPSANSKSEGSKIPSKRSPLLAAKSEPSTSKPSGSAADDAKKAPLANGVDSTKSSDTKQSEATKEKEKTTSQKSQSPMKKPEAVKEDKKPDGVKASSSNAGADSIEKRQAAAAAAAAAAGSDAVKKTQAPSANASSAASVAKAGGLRRIRVTEALPELVSLAQSCVYEPAEFFVAWQGVLTIIYTGIPPSLVKLKSKMAEQFPGLPPESPGSLWPKTSLACLKDDKRLSPEQLQQLRDICSKMNFQLVYSPVIHVNTVSVVIYENCCLEKQLVSTHIQLQQPEDVSPVSEEQRTHVRKVADEFSPKNLQNYWFHVSKDGNRSKHYHQNKAGATLVHFLGDEVPPSVATFQKLVEAAMPGMYDWFSPESLHITLRSLC